MNGNSHGAARRRLLLAGASLAALPAGARAQAGWPSKPLRLIVPFPAGGGADVGARLLVQQLSPVLGKPVVVENRAGGDGVIAAQEAARSAPDGHTLYLATSSSLSYVPAVKKTLPYDPIGDFTAVTRFMTFTFFLFVHESIPGGTLEEVCAHVRANPGKYSYASANSTGILATAQLAQSANLDMVHVPYKGEGQVVGDLSSGRVHMMFVTPAVTAALLKEGKTRPVAVLLPQRSSVMPNVPTIAEAGQPLVDISPWGAIVVPAKTPNDVVDRLSRELNAIYARPAFRAQMDSYGLLLVGGTPDETNAFLREQLAAWSRAARQAKLPID